jgi:hypothetical protein
MRSPAKETSSRHRKIFCLFHCILSSVRGTVGPRRFFCGIPCPPRTYKAAKLHPYCSLSRLPDGCACLGSPARDATEQSRRS